MCGVFGVACLCDVSGVDLAEDSTCAGRSSGGGEVVSCLDVKVSTDFGPGLASSSAGISRELISSPCSARTPIRVPT